MSLIGIISDTHGLLRPEARVALRGADMILHAGDIGNREILEELNTIAPVTAVRGNNDRGDWAAGLPADQLIEVEGISIYMIHDVKQLNFSPESMGYHVVVTGHSHKPSIEERMEVLYVNPGSAGPRRFKLPVSAALLEIADRVSAKIVHLI